MKQLKGSDLALEGTGVHAYLLLSLEPFELDSDASFLALRGILRTSQLNVNLLLGVFDQPSEQLLHVDVEILLQEISDLRKCLLDRCRLRVVCGKLTRFQNLDEE